MTDNVHIAGLIPPEDLEKAVQKVIHQQIIHKSEKTKSKIAKKISRADISRKSKRQGTREENKISKILGEWIFNDKFALHKHDTSGARKEVYIGDVVPQKQIPWSKWFLNVECKSGYEDDIPNFWCQSKFISWFKKALKESNESSAQKIVFIIMQFKNKPKILATNYLIKKVPFRATIPVDWENRKFAYFYILKTLQQYKFEELFDIENILKSLGEP